MLSITLGWCFSVLNYCWFADGLTPNGSSYPELDFAACALPLNYEQDDAVIGNLLPGLGNANDKPIEQRIKFRKIFVGAQIIDSVAPERVVMTTSKPGIKSLEAGRKYI